MPTPCSTKLATRARSSSSDMLLRLMLLMGWLMCVTTGCAQGCDEELEPDQPDLTAPDQSDAPEPDQTPDAQDADPADQDGSDTPDTSLPELDMAPDAGPDAGPSVDMRPDPIDLDAFDFGPQEDAALVDVRIDALIPPRGPLDGGTPFVIEGAGFTPDTVVFFGASQAQAELVEGALIGQTPRGSGPGTVLVRVIDPQRSEDALTDGFTYVPALRLTSASPARLPTTGLIEVEVRGAGFDDATRVSFGGDSALSHQLVDPTLLRVVAPPRATAGAVTLRASHRDASASLPDAITYFETLRVDTARPASGTLAGGEKITLYGAGLEQGVQIELGGRTATLQEVSLAGDYAIILSPAATSSGLVNARVINPDGSAALGQDIFTYSDGVTPELLRVTPDSGPLGGAQEITLYGAQLDGPELEVALGGQVATIVERGTGHITALTPAGAAPGLVEVAITDGANTIAALPHAYTYLPDLSLSQIAPVSGNVTGGDIVTLNGRGLTGVERVLFGGVQAPAFTLDSDVRLTVTAPARAAGVVDVEVVRGPLRARLVDAFTYTEALDVFGFSPVRGSIAGNTYVELLGRGFTADTAVSFGAEAGVDVRLLDSQTLAVRAPAALTPGPVTLTCSDVKAMTQVTAAQPYTYFNPGARFGGAWGGPIQGAVNVTVYSFNGGPVEDAFVMLSTRADTLYQGLTSADGLITLSGPDVFGEQTVTAIAAGHSAATVQRVDAENITIFLTPEVPPSGNPPISPLPAQFVGELTGLNKLAEPSATQFRMVVITTTQSDAGSPNPNPGSNNILLADGSYSLTSRLGDLAVVALGGLYDNSTQTFMPLSMGVARYLFASEGQTYTVDIDLNIPLDQSLTIKLNNPPLHPTGPNSNESKIWMDFGFEGLFGGLPVQRGLTSILPPAALPALSGQLAGVSLFIEAGSYTNGNAPYSIGMLRNIITLNQALDVPLIGVAKMTSPAEGMRPTDGLISFDVTSTDRPDLFYVRIETFMRQTRWEAFIPGSANSFRIPDFPDFSHLPADQRPTPYTGEVLSMLIIGIKQPGINVNQFTYSDLNLQSWTAYSVAAHVIQL